MEKIFDFEQVGKRMPYTVPDGFFDKFEEDMMLDVKAEVIHPKSRKKARTVKIALRSAIAVAAVIALFFVVRATLPKATSEREQIDARIAFAEREQARPKVKSEPVLASADDFASVELAFNNLSTDDQDFLIAVYEDEDYINVLTKTEDYE